MARILMFSSGMDSLMMKELYGYSDEECLFINMGTKENIQEKKLIDTYFPLVRQISLPLVQFELPNKIIPFRNQILCYIAAQIGSEIGFAFTAGDTTRDKDFVFKAQMEGSLNYFCGIESKSPLPGQVYELFIPFKHFTKTEILRLYIDQKNDIDLILHKSVSCYEGTKKPCGKCRSCLRKFVALVLNNVSYDGLFMENPMKYMDSFYMESIKKDRKIELEEIESCIYILKNT